VSNPDATRTRILEAAWELVRERGPSEVTIGEIAAAAGVSRQLVYFHFANRSGLLVAMARHHDVRSGFGEQVRVADGLEPAAALESLLRAWLAYVPDILPVAEALEAALITGEDGAEIYRDRMGELLAILRAALERVDLADGWTVDQAADWVWARCQPSDWRHLVAERGWEPAEYVDRTVRSILHEILKPVRGNV
jgi:AcrR family transcriptional regulator